MLSSKQYSSPTSFFRGLNLIQIRSTLCSEIAAPDNHTRQPHSSVIILGKVAFVKGLGYNVYVYYLTHAVLCRWQSELYFQWSGADNSCRRCRPSWRWARYFLFILDFWFNVILSKFWACIRIAHSTPCARQSAASMLYGTKAVSLSSRAPGSSFSVNVSKNIHCILM